MMCCAVCCQAVFDGGDYCHKNPARSLRVKLECGSEEKAWDASEPEVCAYVVHASTPAACKRDKLKELEDTFQVRQPLLIKTVCCSFNAFEMLVVCLLLAMAGPLSLHTSMALCTLCELWYHTTMPTVGIELVKHVNVLHEMLQALLDEEAALAAEIAAEEAQRQQELAALREKIEGASPHDEL